MSDWNFEGSTRKYCENDEDYYQHQIDCFKALEEKNREEREKWEANGRKGQYYQYYLDTLTFKPKDGTPYSLNYSEKTLKEQLKTLETDLKASSLDPFDKMGVYNAIQRLLDAQPLEADEIERWDAPRLFQPNYFGFGTTRVADDGTPIYETVMAPQGVTLFASVEAARRTGMLAFTDTGNEKAFIIYSNGKGKYWLGPLKHGSRDNVQIGLGEQPGVIEEICHSHYGEDPSEKDIQTANLAAAYNHRTYGINRSAVSHYDMNSGKWARVVGTAGSSNASAHSTLAASGSSDPTRANEGQGAGRPTAFTNTYEQDVISDRYRREQEQQAQQNTAQTPSNNSTQTEQSHEPQSELWALKSTTSVDKSERLDYVNRALEAIGPVINRDSTANPRKNTDEAVQEALNTLENYLLDIHAEHQAGETLDSNDIRVSKKILFEKYGYPMGATQTVRKKDETAEAARTRMVKEYRGYWGDERVSDEHAAALKNFDALTTEQRRERLYFYGSLEVKERDQTDVHQENMGSRARYTNVTRSIPGKDEEGNDIEIDKTIKIELRGDFSDWAAEAQVGADEALRKGNFKAYEVAMDIAFDMGNVDRLEINGGWRPSPKNKALIMGDNKAGGYTNERSNHIRGNALDISEINDVRMHNGEYRNHYPAISEPAIAKDFTKRLLDHPNVGQVFTPWQMRTATRGDSVPNTAREPDRNGNLTKKAWKLAIDHLHHIHFDVR